MRASTVIEAASEVTGVPVSILRSPRRILAEYVGARRLAVFVCREFYNIGYVEIGAAFGHTGHGTAHGQYKTAMDLADMNGGRNLFANLAEQIRLKAESIEHAAIAAERRTA